MERQTHPATQLLSVAYPAPVPGPSPAPDTCTVLPTFTWIPDRTTRSTTPVTDQKWRVQAGVRLDQTLSWERAGVQDFVAWALYAQPSELKSGCPPECETTTALQQAGSNREDTQRQKDRLRYRATGMLRDPGGVRPLGIFNGHTPESHWGSGPGDLHANAPRSVQPQTGTPRCPSTGGQLVDEASSE